MTTGTDICTSALLKARVTGVGNPPDAEQTARSFSLLNDMLALWSSQRWLTFHLLDFGIVATGQQSYSIGPAGDINVTARPDRIESAYIRILNQGGGLPVDYPLSPILSREDYSRVTLKTMVSQPNSYFYDSDFPLGKIYPVPIPKAAIYELHVTTRVIMPQLAKVSDAIALPPEYSEAIKWNLARRIRAEWGYPKSEEINSIAQNGLNVIRSSNVQVPTLQIPAGLGRGGGAYNFFSDTGG
jgi:hypothetical protein